MRHGWEETRPRRGKRVFKRDPSRLAEAAAPTLPGGGSILPDAPARPTLPGCKHRTCKRRRAVAIQFGAVFRSSPCQSRKFRSTAAKRFLDAVRTCELSLSNKGKLRRDWPLIASYSWRFRSVRIRGLAGAIAASVHVLPPNQPGVGIQTTHYPVQDHQVSARPHHNSAGSNPDGFRFREACRNVFRQRSRHIDAGGTGNAGGRGGCGVPSIARRQIQYRSGRAGQTRRKTPGPATTLPETE